MSIKYNRMCTYVNSTNKYTYIKCEPFKVSKDCGESLTQQSEHHLCKNFVPCRCIDSKNRRELT